MSRSARYTLYHPRWYRPSVSVWWWLKSRAYTRFVLRELTSVFVAYTALLILWKLRALAEGPDQYARFVERMKSPFFVVLNGVALVWVLFHSLTWFNLAPKAMVLRWGGKRLPDWAIQGMNYLAWVVVSLVLLRILRNG